MSESPMQMIARDQLRIKLAGKEAALALGHKECLSQEAIESIITFLLEPTTTELSPGVVMALCTVDSKSFSGRRKALGIKQYIMAAELGITQPKLCSIERGTHTSPRMLAIVDKYLRDKESVTRNHTATEQEDVYVFMPCVGNSPAGIQ